MKSPRYKNRHVSDDDLAAEMLMRGEVRTYIRVFYPDVPRPNGQDWLFWESGLTCPICPSTTKHVRVPGVDLPKLLICPRCGTISEHIELG